MGGLGSGIWTRRDALKTLESLKRIDISYLKKLGALSSFSSGTLSWTRNGESKGIISYQCHPDHIELNYNFSRGGSNEWHPVCQHINFETTPCNYGGVRYWFLCSNCYRRVGVLCAADKLFLCRHCYKTPYDSQNESRLERLNSKKNKIAERIFEDYKNGRGWHKKKGMHQKTFDRLSAQYRQLEYKYLVEYDDLFDRLQTLF